MEDDPNGGHLYHHTTGGEKFKTIAQVRAAIAGKGKVTITRHPRGVLLGAETVSADDEYDDDWDADEHEDAMMLGGGMVLDADSWHH